MTVITPPSRKDGSVWNVSEMPTTFLNRGTETVICNRVLNKNQLIKLRIQILNIERRKTRTRLFAYFKQLLLVQVSAFLFFRFSCTTQYIVYNIIQLRVLEK